MENFFHFLTVFAFGNLKLPFVEFGTNLVDRIFLLIRSRVMSIYLHKHDKQIDITEKICRQNSLQI